MFMKQKILIVISLIGLVNNSISAQQFVESDYINSSSFIEPNNFFIPKEFTYNSTPLLEFCVDEGEAYRYSVYDENINLVSTMNVNKSIETEYKRTYLIQEREILSVEKTSDISESMGKTFNQFIQSEIYLNPNLTPENYEEFFKIQKTEAGDSLIFLKETNFNNGFIRYEDYYFLFDKFGLTYPKRYFRCTNDVMFRCMADYVADYGDWKTVDKEEEVNINSFRTLHLGYLDLNNTNFCSIKFRLTQTLFNSHSGFEYLMPKMSVVDIPETESGYEQINEFRRRALVRDLRMVGFQVYDEHGNTIKDIDFGTDFSSSPYAVYVVAIGDKTYLSFYSSQKGVLFYNIDRGTTNIQRVKNVPNSMSIFPPVVDKNTNLNITFGDENKEGSEIVIHSASGSLIKTANVPSGQRNTSIRISNSRGIYNVSRVKNGNVIESKKIAVK